MEQPKNQLFITVKEISNKLELFVNLEYSIDWDIDQFTEDLEKILNSHKEKYEEIEAEVHFSNHPTAPIYENYLHDFRDIIGRNLEDLGMNSFRITKFEEAYGFSEKELKNPKVKKLLEEIQKEDDDFYKFIDDLDYVKIELDLEVLQDNIYCVSGRKVIWIK